MLIGICGLISSGKGTVGDYLTDKYGFEKTSFASTLKDAVAKVFSWDRDTLEGATAEARKLREQEDEWWTKRLGKPISMRSILQIVGTEAFRNQVHYFKNEIESIHKLGGIVIEIRRDTPEWYSTAEMLNRRNMNTPSSIDIDESIKKQLPHISEWEWIGNPNISEVIYNDSTLESLKVKIDGFANRNSILPSSCNYK